METTRNLTQQLTTAVVQKEMLTIQFNFPLSSLSTCSRTTQHSVRKWRELKLQASLSSLMMTIREILMLRAGLILMDPVKIHSI